LGFTGKGTNVKRVNLSKSQYITHLGSQFSKLVLETPTTDRVSRIRNASPPSALENMSVVIRHDHLGPKRGIDDAVINVQCVIHHSLYVKVFVFGTRNVHGGPDHILDQNSTIIQKFLYGPDVIVPVKKIYKTPVRGGHDTLKVSVR
jgi:hypothetical protein